MNLKFPRLHSFNRFHQTRRTRILRRSSSRSPSDALISFTCFYRQPGHGPSPFLLGDPPSNPDNLQCYIYRHSLQQICVAALYRTTRVSITSRCPCPDPQSTRLSAGPLRFLRAPQLVRSAATRWRRVWVSSTTLTSTAAIGKAHSGTRTQMSSSTRTSKRVSFGLVLSL